MLGAKHSLAPAPTVIQVDHRYDAPPVEEQITSGKIAMKMSSAQDAEPGPTPQKCAVPLQEQVQVTLFANIVVVLTTSQVDVTTNLITIERNQGQCLGTSGNADQIIPTTG